LFLQNWTESTDPEKFVHEDVAIATYLILLWEEESEKPTFIDLGCGNGLLVYILNREGYEGCGVDIRSRKIWDSYGNIDLRVETVVPSSSSRFPSHTWLLGNHSDELTPWIPVMAALTSGRTKFFVLPCCPFKFNGKFTRTKTQTSVYREYLDYVKEASVIFV
jgi:tRNASer (uridine44-2'-O)-methyltransferase